jgi:hypothetical protein
MGLVLRRTARKRPSMALVVRTPGCHHLAALGNAQQVRIDGFVQPILDDLHQGPAGERAQVLAPSQTFRLHALHHLERGW